MSKHLDGRPVVFRAYYWPALGWWRGYVGSDVPGVSYGLCRAGERRHHHTRQATAVACAKKNQKGRLVQGLDTSGPSPQ